MPAGNEKNCSRPEMEVEPESSCSYILDAIPDLIAILDEDRHIIGMNRALEEKLGRPCQELMDLECWKLFHGPGTSRAPDDCPYEKMLRTGKSETGDIRVEAFGGCYMVRCTPIRKADGSLSRVVHVATDITARKEAEERIRRLLDEKEILLKEVHHRMRNTLGTVSSLISLQAQGIGDPRAVAALQDLQNRVKTISAVYGKLLESSDFRSIEVGAYLSPLIDDIVSVFPNAPEVKLRKRFIGVSLDSSLVFPIGLIINELVTNSMKHAFPQGGGTIRVEMCRDGDWLRLEVGDDGCALEEAHSDEKHVPLGLMLVKNLVKQLRGKMESLPGPGTSFAFTFPYPDQGEAR